MIDTELLDWLEEQDCYSLISDDGGHWACVVEGMQNVPLGDEPNDIQTTFFVKAHEWKNTVREAIEAAIQKEEE